MKKILFSVIFISLWGSLFGQLTIESDISKNVLTSQLRTGDNNLDTGLQDLFFSISPNGVPQYGRDVKWNLWSGTNDEVRYYRVKKGSWGRQAINDSIALIEYNDEVVFDPADTPDMDMKENWVKLSKSWNFSRGAFTIVVLSIKNQSREVMETARVEFKYPIADLAVSEVKIYNDWAAIEQIELRAEEKTYSIVADNLLPGEVRHLYFYMEVLEKNQRELEESLLTAELIGHPGASLLVNKTNPPHDPNGLILVNALVNTPLVLDCEGFSGHPVLEEVCASGVPFWYNNLGDDPSKECHFFNGRYCDLDYSLNYPYCNIDQEKLTYQITCLNDGQGTAGKVIMRTLLEGEDLLLEESFRTDESSHDVLTTLTDLESEFLFEGINLPGLNDPEVVYMYDECSAQVIFSIDTQCDVNGDIWARGDIEFYDIEGNLADELATNSVTAVPKQGQFDNVSPKCIDCIGRRLSPEELNISEKYILSTSEDKNYITISGLETNAFDLVDRETTLRIVDVSGRVIMQLTIPASQLLHLGHRIEVSSLPSGLYILSGEDGKKRFAKKFIH